MVLYDDSVKAVRNLLFLMPTLLLFSCSETREAAPEPGDWQSAAMTEATLEKWQRSCALCHVAGEGGAPRMGDSEAWAYRLDQGAGVLMKSTTDGLNRMPPQGYCMDCSEADFAAMIKMMAGVQQ